MMKRDNIAVFVEAELLRDDVNLCHRRTYAANDFMNRRISVPCTTVRELILTGVILPSPISF
jgi:hypothetical protein